ncbi:MAG: hypothetical protein RIM96_13100 [Thalassobaculum sp.]|uniref:hypothetical protein n=1 Tax=Thalassobaculum sp. TaxID=2022740 RepID=UPI0032EAFBC5
MPSRYLDDIDPESPSHAAGSPGGRIVEYKADDRWSLEQLDFREWFRAVAVDGMVPQGTPIDRLARYLGHIHKLEVGRGGTDFRYRIYGNLIAAEANMRMQDRWVSELQEPTSGIVLEHYRRLCGKPRLFVGELRYAGGETMRYPVWLRAEAPIGTRDAGTLGFIVLTLPLEHASLMPEDEAPGGGAPDAGGPPPSV